MKGDEKTMKWKSTLSLLMAGALALGTANTLTRTSNTASAISKTDTIKIMAIGDSITDGYGIAGSYRKFLYNSLTELGYDINMVGKGDYQTSSSYLTSYDSGDGTSFSYDDDNFGFSGYSIQSYSGRTGIYETLQSYNSLATYSPDIVILQIGTNDVLDNHELSTSGDRLGELIEYIFTQVSSDTAVFVTTIPDLEPNRSDVYSWFSAYRYDSNWQQVSDSEVETLVQSAVDSYNSIVVSTVTSLQSSYSNLYLGDINSVITDTTTQLADGVHPNNVGYKLMGEYWAEILSSYLEGTLDSGSTTTTAATTTTTTTTMTTTTTTTTETTTPETTTTTETTTPETTTTTEATTTTTSSEPVAMTTTSTSVTEESTTTTTKASEETTTTTTTERTRPGENTTTTATTTSEETTTTTEKTDSTTMTTTTDQTTTTTTATTQSPEDLVGDVNGDGAVTILDLVALTKYVLKDSTTLILENADLDGDGSLTVYDVTLLKQMLVK